MKAHVKNIHDKKVVEILWFLSLVKVKQLW